jgi:hypothetical protein
VIGLKMRMARNTDIFHKPMNYAEEFTVFALSEGIDHFVRIGNNIRHFDLVGDFLRWEEADDLAQQIANSMENVNYVSMR